MVKIRNERLVLPRGYANLNELASVLIRPPHQPNTDNEPVVVVSSVKGPPCAVPRAVITLATQEVHGSFIHLFWAEDEDRGDREVLIAWDTKMSDQPERAEDEDRRWFIVEKGWWVQAPFGKELIQLFNNKSEALRCLGDHKIVVVPTDTVPGWMAAIVDGPYDYDFSDIKEHPDLVKFLEIPDGFEIGSLVNIRNVTLGEILMDTPEAEGIIDYCVECIVVTSDGGVFIAASTKSDKVGEKVIGRKFTHEETKKVLHL